MLFSTASLPLARWLLSLEVFDQEKIAHESWKTRMRTAWGGSETPPCGSGAEWMIGFSPHHVETGALWVLCRVVFFFAFKLPDDGALFESLFYLFLVRDIEERCVTAAPAERIPLTHHDAQARRVLLV